MKKIKFTSKKCSRPSAIQRAALMKPLTLIYFEEESVASVSGSDEIILYCKSKNILLRLKEPSTHREAVDWVKAHVLNNFGTNTISLLNLKKIIL